MNNQNKQTKDHLRVMMMLQRIGVLEDSNRQIKIGSSALCDPLVSELDSYVQENRNVEDGDVPAEEG